jgi:uncharacterized coiled-coil protein SlyX
MSNKEKIERLPLWVRELIHELETQAEPQAREITLLKKRIQELEKLRRKLQDRIEAMVEMFQCAAKGGNEVALAVRFIVEDFLVSNEN